MFLKQFILKPLAGAEQVGIHVRGRHDGPGLVGGHPQGVPSGDLEWGDAYPQSGTDGSGNLGEDIPPEGGSLAGGIGGRRVSIQWQNKQGKGNRR